MHLHEEYAKRNSFEFNCVLRNTNDIIFLNDSKYDYISIYRDVSLRPFIYKFDFCIKGEVKKSIDITWENYERFIFFINRVLHKKFVFDKRQIKLCFWSLTVVKNQDYFLNNIDRKKMFDSFESLKIIDSIVSENKSFELKWKNDLNSIFKRYAFWLEMLS